MGPYHIAELNCLMFSFKYSMLLCLIALQLFSFKSFIFIQTIPLQFLSDLLAYLGDIPESATDLCGLQSPLASLPSSVPGIIMSEGLVRWKLRLEYFAYETLQDLRIGKLFEIIVDYPDRYFLFFHSSYFTIQVIIEFFCFLRKVNGFLVMYKIFFYKDKIPLMIGVVKAPNIIKIWEIIKLIVIFLRLCKTAEWLDSQAFCALNPNSFLKKVALKNIC